VHRFHGGVVTWTGCPRLSAGHREEAWIRCWDRAGGKLTASEQLHLPMLLVDVFDVLDELRAQAEAYERERTKQKG
jgi:hypothetical protein